VTVKSISDNAESVELPFRIFTTLNYITHQQLELDISAPAVILPCQAGNVALGIFISKPRRRDSKRK
jgi:hypothetical protein